jgi:hypothetical protein
MTWRQLLELRPELRERLYKSRRLFFLTAYGAATKVREDSLGNPVIGISIRQSIFAVKNGVACRNRKELQASLNNEESALLDEYQEIANQWEV